MRGSAVEDAIRDLIELVLDDTDAGPDENEITEIVEREVQNHLDQNLETEIAVTVARSKQLEDLIDEFRRELIEEITNRSWSMRIKRWWGSRVSRCRQAQATLKRRVRGTMSVFSRKGPDHHE